MVVVLKAKGRWQMCVDLHNLNKFVQHPYYPLITLWEAVQQVPAGASFFSTLDAKSAQDEYCRQGDQAIEGLDNISKVVNNIVVLVSTGAPARCWTDSSYTDSQNLSRQSKTHEVLAPPRNGLVEANPDLNEDKLTFIDTKRPRTMVLPGCRGQWI